MRNPTYDCFWLLSGPAIAVILLWIMPQNGALIGGQLVPIFWITLALQDGHLLAPMALAWGHKGYRDQVMRPKPWKYAALPAAIVLGCAGVGLALGGSLHINPSLINWHPDYRDLNSPLVDLLAIYIVWNVWHFASQNYGILSIYRRRSGSGRRWLDRAFCIGCQLATVTIGYFTDSDLGPVIIVLTLAGTAIVALFETRASPRLLFIAANALGVLVVAAAGSWLWAFAIWQLNHWTVALGVAGHTWGNHHRRSPLWFIGAMMTAGVALFWFLFAPHFTIDVVSWAVGARLGIAFVHFLYDRRLYRFSDPTVRATIGTAVLTPTG